MENHFNCIYCYTNKVNGKKYIGQTVDFIKRHNLHIRQSYNEKCKAYNQYFHNAIRKYGIENFEIEILTENLKNQDELNHWECFYIVEFDTLAKNGKGYNLASGGSNGNPYAGKTDEEMVESSRKMSEAMKETWKNKTDKEIAEFSRKWHEAMKNKSDEEIAEIRRKQSEAMKNKSDEELVEILRKRHETMKNKSDEELTEIRRKRSEAMKGKNNPRARNIVSVDPLTKQPVFTWQYKQQAKEFYGIGNNTLDYYLKGKAKSGHLYNGFLWYYADEWEQLIK